MHGRFAHSVFIHGRLVPIPVDWREEFPEHIFVPTLVTIARAGVELCRVICARSIPMGQSFNGVVSAAVQQACRSVCSLAPINGVKAVGDQ